MMNWEISILQSLQAIRNPFLNAVMEAISFMAEAVFIVMIIATLYWCVDKRKMKRLAWLLLCSSCVTGVLKNIFKKPRPFQRGIVSPLRVETATSYSFPSGHTQAATCFWIGAAKIFKNRGLYIIGGIIVALTAISRVYLGVHWPTDVIAAVLSALLVIYIVDLLYDEVKGFNSWHVMGVSVIAIIFMVLPVDKDLATAVGCLWGLVIGGYVEQHYINFKEAGTWKQQLIKILIGVGGLGIIYIVYGALLPSDPILDLIKFALIMIWITAGAPYLFKALLKNQK